MALARRVRGSVGLFKVGSQLFTAEGPQAVEKIAGLGAEIFLDLKFHDIPNTVAGAVRAAADLPDVSLLTLHTSGGSAMMRAAREALAGRKARPALLGVTVLTSLDSASLREVGMSGSARSLVAALARLAQRSGLDGVVASGHEVGAIRKACGPKFLIVVPGVRSPNADTNDQSRTVTPREAIQAGANCVVVGRPITGAADPRAAARAIAQEIEAARV